MNFFVCMSTLLLFTVIVDSARAELNIQEQACEDLYVSACVNAGGIVKQKLELKDMKKALSAEVEKAKTALKNVLGADLLMPLRNSLEEKGLKLKKDLSSNAQAALNGYSWTTDSELFEEIAQCDAQKNELLLFQPYGIADIGQLQDQLYKWKSFLHTTTNMKNRLARLAVLKVVDKIKPQCAQFRKLTFAQQNENVFQELRKICVDPNAVRIKILTWYRQENNPNTQSEIEAWLPEAIKAVLLNIAETVKNPELIIVRKQFNPETAGQAIFGLSKGGFGLNKTGVLNSLRSKISSLASQNWQSCYVLDDSTLLTGIAKSEQAQILQKMYSSQPVIESLLASHYSEDKKQKTMALFEQIKTEVQRLTDRIIGDENLRSKVKSKYQSLKLGWLDKPADSEYKIDPQTGLRYLDLSDSSFNLMAKAFGDPSLSFFTTLNAFYMPDLTIGEMFFSSSVNIMPAFMWMIDHNPEGVLSVMAHEVGHQIGPQMSFINGHDLRPTHKPMLQCLAQPDSIYMQANQGDESISDMIAAEVLAQIASNSSDLSERLRYIQSGVQTYCLMDMMEQQESSIRTRGDVHPNPYLRVGGLFGANSSLRKVLGCQKDSKNYRTCGW